MITVFTSPLDGWTWTISEQGKELLMAVLHPENGLMREHRVICDQLELGFACAVPLTIGASVGTSVGAVV